MLAAGGKVLNLVNLGDVYLTFFSPKNGRWQSGPGQRGARGSLESFAPLYVIPAKVSYVASVAQFTPKTVDAASERQN